MKNLIITVAVIICVQLSLFAQAPGQAEYFTRQDTLRGSVTPERAWWDVTYYHLDIKVNISDSSLLGSNTIQYKVIQQNQKMQIDLQPPMSITRVIQDKKEIQFVREGNAYFIFLEKKQKPGTIREIRIEYTGKPREALRAPWDGGFSWDSDKEGNPFVATSCQEIGASLWWPNKDHMYDEVDSMLISVNVKDPLIAVSNGSRRTMEKKNDGTTTYHWFVSNPINNYGVNVNIADYVHFSEVYRGEEGELKCDYYVLKENLEKAKEQFKQVPMMLEAFEYWFGPYPFYNDGYKLVEVPYLGMEHQSSITYGNGYRNGYRGTDLSGTGWGLEFDFIIIHESGHEWFANSITYKDIADMWIHESFTNYSESLYLEYFFGKEAGEAYVTGIRKNIQNDLPIIGKYDVNSRGSGDMYYKGSNMLHTLRQLVDNDTLWREILRGMNREFYHSTVTTQEIEDYLSQQTGINLTSFFDQYLRTTNIPILEYYFDNNRLMYRWINAVPKFNMPVKVEIDGKEVILYATTTWKGMENVKSTGILKVNQNFYVASSKIRK